MAESNTRMVKGEGSDSEDDELAALREAALRSKRSRGPAELQPVEASMPVSSLPVAQLPVAPLPVVPLPVVQLPVAPLAVSCPTASQFHRQPFKCRDRMRMPRPGNQNFTRAPRSNLILIQTVPLDDERQDESRKPDVPQTQDKFSLVRPQDKWAPSDDVKPSASHAKSKVPTKFTRFDGSDSDSDEDVSPVEDSDEDAVSYARRDRAPTVEIPEERIPDPETDSEKLQWDLKATDALREGKTSSPASPRNSPSLNLKSIPSLEERSSSPKQKLNPPTSAGASNLQPVKETEQSVLSKTCSKSSVHSKSVSSKSSFDSRSVNSGSPISSRSSHSRSPADFSLHSGLASSVSPSRPGSHSVSPYRASSVRSSRSPPRLQSSYSPKYSPKRLRSRTRSRSPVERIRSPMQVRLQACSKSPSSVRSYLKLRTRSRSPASSRSPRRFLRSRSNSWSSSNSGTLLNNRSKTHLRSPLESRVHSRSPNKQRPPVPRHSRTPSLSPNCMVSKSLRSSSSLESIVVNPSVSYVGPKKATRSSISPRSKEFAHSPAFARSSDSNGRSFREMRQEKTLRSPVYAVGSPVHYNRPSGQSRLPRNSKSPTHSKPLDISKSFELSHHSRHRHYYAKSRSPDSRLTLSRGSPRCEKPRFPSSMQARQQSPPPLRLARSRSPLPRFGRSRSPLLPRFSRSRSPAFRLAGSRSPPPRFVRSPSIRFASSRSPRFSRSRSPPRFARSKSPSSWLGRSPPPRFIGPRSPLYTRSPSRGSGSFLPASRLTKHRDGPTSYNSKRQMAAYIPTENKYSRDGNNRADNNKLGSRYARYKYYDSPSETSHQIQVQEKRTVGRHNYSADGLKQRGASGGYQNNKRLSDLEYENSMERRTHRFDSSGVVKTADKTALLKSRRHRLPTENRDGKKLTNDVSNRRCYDQREQPSKEGRMGNKVITEERKSGFEREASEKKASFGERMKKFEVDKLEQADSKMMKKNEKESEVNYDALSKISSTDSETAISQHKSLLSDDSETESAGHREKHFTERNDLTAKCPSSQLRSNEKFRNQRSDRGNRHYSERQKRFADMEEGSARRGYIPPLMEGLKFGKARSQSRSPVSPRLLKRPLSSASLSPAKKPRSKSPSVKSVLSVVKLAKNSGSAHQPPNSQNAQVRKAKDSQSLNKDDPTVKISQTNRSPNQDLLTVDNVRSSQNGRKQTHTTVTKTGDIYDTVETPSSDQRTIQITFNPKMNIEGGVKSSRPSVHQRLGILDVTGRDKPGDASGRHVVTEEKRFADLRDLIGDKSRQMSYEVDVEKRVNENEGGDEELPQRRNKPQTGRPRKLYHDNMAVRGNVEGRQPGRSSFR